MAVDNFNDFLIAYNNALNQSEDSRIEIAASFAILFELPRIDHGYRLTIASTAGVHQLFALEASADDFRHFKVTNGTLVLEQLIISDHPLHDGISLGGIEVGNKGRFILNGSIIKNCLNQRAGGVQVLRGGRMSMLNGTIRGCRGNYAGAVMVEEDATFIIDGDSNIADCHGIYDAYLTAVIVFGTMIMQNGNLNFTSAARFNGVLVQAGGKFELLDGQISNCLTGITLNEGAQVTIKGGAVAGNDIGIISTIDGSGKVLNLIEGDIHSNRIGIGLNNGIKFTMSGGRIFNHHQTEGAGIVCIYGNHGSFTMTGGEIFNNTQGICWQQNTLTCLIEDGLIYENGYGLLMDHSKVTMYGGKITDNKVVASRYAYSGLGVFVGFFSEFNLLGGEISGNEIHGIYGVYWSMINVENAQIFDNGDCGINALYCDVNLKSGHISANRCGISLDEARVDEPRGSKLVMNGGYIHNNLEDGIRLQGISTALVTAGDIHHNQRMGIKALHQTRTIIEKARINNNYMGVEITGSLGSNQDAVVVMTAGYVTNNTVGVSVNIRSRFNFEDGAIFSNYGYLDNIQTEQGGVGIFINGGQVFMFGGKIHSHRGFSTTAAISGYNQISLGAAICFIGNGNLEIFAGEITDNRAPSGAAIWTPQYSFVKIHEPTYFNKNKATAPLYPYYYAGGIRHVDVNFWFSHTSAVCHILNNYDVNYTIGSLIETTYLDFFPDKNFARVVYEQLDREFDAYIAACEFAPIKKLIANNRQIYSIEGAEHLMNLQEIYLNDNFIIDLSPLGWFKDITFAAHRQWRKLPAIYVSRRQLIGIYNEHIDIIKPEIIEHIEREYTYNELEVTDNIESETLENITREVTDSTEPVTPVSTESKSLDNNKFEVTDNIELATPESSVIPENIEIESPDNNKFEAKENIEIATPVNIESELEIPINTELEYTDNIEFESLVNNAIGNLKNSVISLNEASALPVVKFPHKRFVSKSLQPYFKTVVCADVFKYNGHYYRDNLKISWWKDENETAKWDLPIGEEEPFMVWWESGRNALKWQEENFDGYVFQRAIPIPLHILFPEPELAKVIARMLNKNVEETVDITELHRITHLDLSRTFFDQSVAKEKEVLEGLQFLFSLEFLNLKNTGISAIVAAEFLGSHIKIIDG